MVLPESLLILCKQKCWNGLDEICNILKDSSNKQNNYKPAITKKSDSAVFGYRWVCDEDFTLYIVEIKICGEYWQDPLSPEAYATDNCIIISITRHHDQVGIYGIKGKTRAYLPSTHQYFCGNRIEKEHTYFYLSKEELLKNEQHIIHKVTAIHDNLKSIADIIYRTETKPEKTK